MVEIEVSYKRPWTSDMISVKGKKALKEFGLAPPPERQLFTDLDILLHAECPRCGKSNTELRNTFGPTLCRSIHYCNDCREAFEQFKPL
jgi:ring-1,2-phenylacetyl-CoA epoxidase subunit PaaD